MLNPARLLASPAFIIGAEAGRRGGGEPAGCASSCSGDSSPSSSGMTVVARSSIAAAAAASAGPRRPPSRPISTSGRAVRSRWSARARPRRWCSVSGRQSVAPRDDPTETRPRPLRRFTSGTRTSARSGSLIGRPQRIGWIATSPRQRLTRWRHAHHLDRDLREPPARTAPRHRLDAEPPEAAWAARRWRRPPRRGPGS